MEVSKIVAEVLKRLNIHGDYDLEQLQEIDDETLDKIVLSVNSVVAEIGADYLPNRCNETLEVVGGKIPYAGFGRNVVEVKRVTMQGITVKFSPQVEYLKVFCADGHVDVEYNFINDQLTIISQVQMSTRVSMQLLVIGVIADYLIMCGRVEESIVYDRRYRDGLRLAMRDNKPRQLKPRSFY